MADDLTQGTTSVLPTSETGASGAAETETFVGTAQANGPTGIGGTGTGHFPQNSIPPKPLRILNLPQERAAMLATLPRRKWSESSSAALTGIAGAVTGAFDAINKGWERTPFSLQAYETVELLVFFGFFVWLVVSLFYSLRGHTSTEYLNELYPPEGVPNGSTPQR